MVCDELTSVVDVSAVSTSCLMGPKLEQSFSQGIRMVPSIIGLGGAAATAAVGLAEGESFVALGSGLVLLFVSFVVAR